MSLLSCPRCTKTAVLWPLFFVFPFALRTRCRSCGVALRGNLVVQALVIAAGFGLGSIIVGGLSLYAIETPRYVDSAVIVAAIVFVGILAPRDEQLRARFYRAVDRGADRDVTSVD